VLAAASLGDAFAELEQTFEAAYPDVDVVVATAGSQILRLQLENGARADVFASAHPDHVQALDDGGLVAERAVFAYNALAIAVPRDNPAGVESAADLARARRLVVGAPEVPIGRYTGALLARLGRRYGAEFSARVAARVVSREPNVRLVRAKVALGEADAAVVYRSDLVSPAAAESLRMVAIPAPLNPRVGLHVALLSDAPEPEWARLWYELLASSDGRAVLAAYGFSPP
jgi:molybdate transport system substrate-binding protein